MNSATESACGSVSLEARGRQRGAHGSDGAVGGHGGGCLVEIILDGLTLDSDIEGVADLAREREEEVVEDAAKAISLCERD